MSCLENMFINGYADFIALVFIIFSGQLEKDSNNILLLLL